MSKIKHGLEIKFGTQYGKEEEETVIRVLRNRRYSFLNKIQILYSPCI